MTYYTGSVAAVPQTRRQHYIAHVAAAWTVFQRHGATRMVETWGVDVEKGKVTDLYRAVDAREDEAITFSWIEWPDKETADAAWASMEADPAMQDLPERPFDGSRMIYGGFAPVFAAGNDRGAGYLQGFVLVVPETRKDAYIALAEGAWTGAFQPGGCLGTVEAWGIDVPRGQKTDFYRATKAEDAEVPMFSWTAWPDKATCDAAAKAMEANVDVHDYPEMPFDGMRMMWGGFEPIFDSDNNA